MAADLGFGQWNEKGTYAYTEIFDKIAKRDKSDDAPQVQHTSTKPGAEESLKTKKEQPIGHGRYVLPQLSTDSPTHRNADSSMARNSPSRVPRASIRSHRSREASPLDPRIPTRVVQKEAPGSPSLKKGGLNQSNHGRTSTTPGRSKFARNAEIDPDEGVVIPKLSKLDPNDPSIKDLTGKFEIMRNEREAISVKVPSIDVEPPEPRRRRNKSMSCFCFLCPRK